MQQHLLTLFFIGLSCFSASSHAAIFRPAGSVNNLIAAINTANSNNEVNIIDLGGMVYGLSAVDNNFFGSNGLPAISSQTELAIINGTIKRLTTAPLFRFFYVAPGAKLTLFNITLEFGLAVDEANLNNAFQVDDANRGGAIHNFGCLNVEDSVLSNNFAQDVGGAIYNNSVIKNINNVLFMNNQSAAGGGGIYNDAGTIQSIADSTLYDNLTVTNGAGINNNAGYIGRILNSAIIDNNSNANGGGIYNGSLATIEILANTTISGNAATADGGGVYNAGTISFYNSTIANNTGIVGGGIYNALGANIENFFSNLMALNPNPESPDIVNSAVIAYGSEGYNLISNGVSSGIVDSVNNDIVNGDVLIGPLQDNGGRTYTMALMPGSIGINNGSNLLGLTTDQRGPPFLRAVMSVPDIGAYEYQP